MINNYLEILKDKNKEKRYIEKDRDSWKKKQEENKKELEILEATRKIFQKAAEITQQNLSIEVSKIVTNALHAVFPEEPYDFKVQFETKRNVTECSLLFTKNGKQMKPLDSCGYGASDIASLASRCAYWEIDGTAINTMILDEPTRNLDADKQPLASEMIKQLSSQLNIQFLIVTHRTELAKVADRVFKITADKDDINNGCVTLLR